MDSYGDGNVYRGVELKDSEIKTYKITDNNLLEIEAEVFRVIRANSDCKSAKSIMKRIIEHLPDDVDIETINRAIGNLCKRGE